MGDIADYYSAHQIFYDYKEEEKPFLHKCKNGKLVDVKGISKEYPKMTDSHLINTIKYIKGKSIDGIKIARMGRGIDVDDIWYDEHTIYGKRVFKMLKYEKYLKEARLRNLI